MIALELVWGHGYLAGAIVVCMIVTLAILDWISEKDRRGRR